MGKHSARGSREGRDGREGSGDPDAGSPAGYDTGGYAAAYGIREYDTGEYESGGYPLGYEAGRQPAAHGSGGYDAVGYPEGYDTGGYATLQNTGGYATTSDTGGYPTVEGTGGYAAVQDAGGHGLPADAFAPGGPPPGGASIAADAAPGGPAIPGASISTPAATSPEGTASGAEWGTPPHGAARPPRGASVRGGHPEQREPGGGWGALGESPISTGPQGGARIPGPRREHLDAFDGPAAPTWDTRGPAGHGGGDGGAGPISGISDDGSRIPAPARAGGGSGTGVSAHARGGTPAGRGGKARAITGVAAAAVTAVLAVVVAGQVADGKKGAGDTDTRQDVERGVDDTASRGQGRATPNGAARAAALTYDQKMAKTYPLDPKLQGSGSFTTVAGHDKPPRAISGEVKRYRVDVEKGLPLDGELFAEAVHKTLNDDRSWSRDGRRGFERVSSGRADFVITLASPGTTAKWCAKSDLDTAQENVSCDSAATERVMINAFRWAQGAETFGDRAMHAYRQMLINHEVGHRLGHGHETCAKDGALAPVMMQQTKFLTTDGATCRPNPWPFPKGDADEGGTGSGTGSG
ncbi:DUF3152 domain-containing protein [Streptomyces sp. LX-29]|uniref:DUF3152 domain-containing protein n=1 Tax=Streptomyces sp. LX-29 TaxID=2900152 RepID=UPI00240D3225|nr:DUF3152 domain-containing protein [Streptomyces sp. LX-29]WFB07544.1 DUF3152 domain-containing protein [Streptomyces sp. LX-29]